MSIDSTRLKGKGQEKIPFLEASVSSFHLDGLGWKAVMLSQSGIRSNFFIVR